MYSCKEENEYKASRDDFSLNSYHSFSDLVMLYSYSLKIRYIDR